MGFLKFVVWTACCIALGIYVSTARYEGGTPLEQLERVWRRHVPAEPVAALQSEVKGAVASARAAISPQARPSERHTPEDRAAVNKLIAKRTAPR